MFLYFCNIFYIARFVASENDIKLYNQCIQNCENTENVFTSKRNQSLTTTAYPKIRISAKFSSENLNGKKNVRGRKLVAVYYCLKAPVSVFT